MSFDPDDVPPAEAGTVISLGPGSQVTLKAVSADTDGAYAILEYVAAPGAGSALHTHSREDEAFYVLAGTLTFQIGDQTLAAGPGEYVRIPRGVEHAFANAGDEPVTALIIASPAGLEQFFVELAALVAADAGPEAAAALNRKYGLSFA